MKLMELKLLMRMKVMMLLTVKLSAYSFFSCFFGNLFFVFLILLSRLSCLSFLIFFDLFLHG